MLPPPKTWQKRIQAIAMLHHGYCTLDPQWTQRQTAKDLSLQPDYISMALQTARYLCDPKIAHAPTLEGAYTMVKKKTYQKATRAHDTIAEAILPPQQPPTILPADFLTWAPLYTGPKFGFIHCDFPAQDIAEYIKCLSLNISKILKQSGHAMIWCGMEDCTSTMSYLHHHNRELWLLKHPLVWFRSDNTGPLPSPNRMPRLVYETALMARYGDKASIIRPVPNAYAAPTIKDKTAKPIPMLAHFFQMFIDKNTTMLDAFCPNDNAIHAATRLGAQHICGLRPSVQP